MGSCREVPSAPREACAEEDSGTSSSSVISIMALEADEGTAAFCDPCEGLGGPSDDINYMRHQN